MVRTLLNNVFGFLLLFLMSMGSNSYAQTGAIEGKVTWADQQKRVEDAQVGLLMTSYIAKTNQNGYYRIDSIQPGTYRLKVFLLGYESEVKEVKVDSTLKQVNFKVDTISRELDVVQFESKQNEEFGIRRMRNVEDMGIYSGKKNEVLLMDEMTANKATDKSRQIYAKVAGVHVWESDGAGIQQDVGSRGLNPKRTANFNTRQNGYDISADALGYPETYYAPPTEALSQIQVVRGAASLQYGPQFGGMINYRLKQPPKDDPFQISTRQTLGSFGLFNSYTSVGGTSEDGKIDYFGFYKFKRGDGWRPNSKFRVHNGFASGTYHVNEDFSVSLELTKMNSLAQQPGGLTDQLFEEDPNQSIRERNWFRVDWNMASIELNYQVSNQLKLQNKTFGLLGSRYSLGNLARIDRADHGQERTLLKDQYKNYGNETRLIYNYQLNEQQNTLLLGTRFYQGFTNRKQGFGSDGDGPNFSFVNPKDRDNSEYKFPSSNFAAFAENSFSLTKNLQITPGIRFEHIKTAADGFYKNANTDQAGNLISTKKFFENKKRIRNFALFGLGLSYKPLSFLEVYGNFSENYRAISFNDMRVINPNLKVDPNLQDEKGYTGDLGIRGHVENVLNYDISVFGLSYENKIGSVLKEDEELFRLIRYRTNVADAVHYGVEGYAELGLLKLLNAKKPENQLSLFTNFSWLKATYKNSEESGITGNEVEYAPPFKFKGGLNLELGDFKASYQFSYTEEHYSDATNAERVSSAIHGIIPSYYVMDLSLSYQYDFLTFEGGINNMADHQYFTRRATGYPGPGIIPAKGRSFYVTVGAKF